jgi:hypothetical protein
MNYYWWDLDQLYSEFFAHTWPGEYYDENGNLVALVTEPNSLEWKRPKFWLNEQTPPTGVVYVAQDRDSSANAAGFYSLGILSHDFTPRFFVKCGVRGHGVWSVKIRVRLLGEEAWDRLTKQEKEEVVYMVTLYDKSTDARPHGFEFYDGDTLLTRIDTAATGGVVAFKISPYQYEAELKSGGKEFTVRCTDMGFGSGVNLAIANISSLSGLTRSDLPVVPDNDTPEGYYDPVSDLTLYPPVNASSVNS